MASLRRAAPGSGTFHPLLRPAMALAVAVPLAACAPQEVREDTITARADEGARQVALLEPGPPPPDLAAPSDLVILERLRTRAAARRAEAARLRMDAGTRRFEDVWARIRAGYGLPRPEHPTVTAEREWYAKRPQYLQRTTDRARLYLGYIVQEAERRNLPMELALLPIVESAFQPFARSPAGAMGIWQFIRSTGRHFGLMQTAWYDGRRDIVASTRAAFDYLERLHRDLDGDWLLAVAAYNAGEGNVLRARKRNRAKGKPEDFFSLALPAETRAYVPRLLAISELIGNPDRYGLTLDPIDNAPYFKSVDVGGQIDLAHAADLAGISLNEMMLLNPGFFRHATDPAGPHRLLVPADSAAAFTEGLAASTPDEHMRWRIHTVARGDTLSGIASRNAVSVEQIKSSNGLRNNRLKIGQELKVPASSGTVASAELSPEVRRGIERARQGAKQRVYRVRSGDNLWLIARRNKVSVDKLMRWNGLGRRSVLRPGQKLVIWSTAAAPVKSARASSKAGRANKSKRNNTGMSTEKPAVHVVRNGESLWFIARRYNLSTNDLASWNDIAPGSILRPGQSLRLTPPRAA